MLLGVDRSWRSPAVPSGGTASLTKVDISESAAGTGLKMIAGIKTIDTGIFGAIIISAIVVWVHNRWFDKKLPDFLGIFQGTQYVYAVCFFLMFPVAFLFTLLWPYAQHGIESAVDRKSVV